MPSTAESRYPGTMIRHPTRSGSRRSCCNRPRSIPSSPIIGDFWPGFPILRAWPMRTWTRCSTSGPGWVIMPVHGTCTRPRNRCGISTRVNFRVDSRMFCSCPALDARRPGPSWPFQNTSGIPSWTATSNGCSHRYYAIGGYTGHQPVERSLWALAENHTPVNDVAAYTQAIMDLGATVCTRKPPPMSGMPLARRLQGLCAWQPAAIPPPQTESQTPGENGPDVADRRPAGGISDRQATACRHLGGDCGVCRNSIRPPMWSDGANCNLGLTLTVQKTLPPVKHGLTHFDLTIIPILCQTDNRTRPDWRTRTPPPGIIPITPPGSDYPPPSN